MKGISEDLKEKVTFASDEIEELDAGNNNFEEWTDGILDAEIRTDLYGNVNNVIVTLATGGPHIELDCARGLVIGYWSGEEYEQRISGEKADAIMDYYGEVYSANRS